jgi:hypothetical protein
MRLDLYGGEEQGDGGSVSAIPGPSAVKKTKATAVRSMQRRS